MYLREYHTKNDEKHNKAPWNIIYVYVQLKLLFHGTITIKLRTSQQQKYNKTECKIHGISTTNIWNNSILVMEYHAKKRMKNSKKRRGTSYIFLWNLKLFFHGTMTNKTWDITTPKLPKKKVHKIHGTLAINIWNNNI